MAHIHLIVGPVAAGKSTFAQKLCVEQQAVLLNLDEWFVRLFSPDRPDGETFGWYVERTARCIEQIWALTQRLVDVGTNVVLEIGLIQRRDRERFYKRVDKRGYGLTVYVLDAPRDIRRERVEQRNVEQGATFSMEVPAHIFELASDMWEPPEVDERNARDFRIVNSLG